MEQRSPEKLKKKALPTKLGGVTESKSTFKFFQLYPHSNNLGPIWVVISYQNLEMIEKKLEALFDSVALKTLILVVYDLL